MKIERVARKEPKEHKTIDRMMPINFDKLGSSEDPCFGKHYDMKAKECKKCGDCEICAIVSSQKNLLSQVTEQETKNHFKDTDEAEFVDGQNKELLKYMLAKTKKLPGKWLMVSRVVDKFFKPFNLPDTVTDRTYLTQRVIMVIENEPKLKLSKLKTKYK